MGRNEPFGKMNEVLAKLFSWKGFCKISANVFEIRRDSEFGFPRGERGLGNESVRAFGFF